MSTGSRHPDYATRHYDPPDATQSERRAMLRQDAAAREAPTSYFAKEAVSSDPNAPALVGAAAFGPKLPAPTWSHDPTGKEPPLGEDINALPDMRSCWWREGAVAPGEPTDE